MTRLLHAVCAVLWLTLALAAPAFAVRPDEVLADPALEARARAISAKLRCMVCQNQSIDDSDADLARDLRVLVRERIVTGDTDEQVIDFLVARYGEYVLLEPRFSLRNAALWGAPIVLLLIGGAVIMVFARRRPVAAPEALSVEENAAVDRLLKDG